MPTPVSLQISAIRRIFAATLLAAAPLGCQATARPAPVVSAESGTDLETIRDTVARVTHEIDAKRWVELRRLYADEVTTDYTSLFGGTPVKQTGDALIEGWKSALAKVKTHHQLGPISVTQSSGAATATCQVRGLHQAVGAPGGAEWEVLGHYVFELSKRTDASWRIHAMTLLTRIQTGNTKLLQEVPR